MRFRLLALVLASCALLAAPGAAQAAPVIGISENQPRMFTDPLFTALGAKHARVVVSYNVMTSRDDELGRVSDYLNAASAAGVQVLVSFEHARGDASRCNQRRYRSRRECALPSTRTYERNVRLFFQRFGSQVRAFSPWNEVNHFTQGTARSPRRAAQFSDIGRRYCKGRCSLVALDILDQADDPSAKRPTFSSTLRYIRNVRRYLRAPRTICGVHNYSDTNRFRSTGTRAIIRALGCRQIWLTETGGIYKFGRSFPASARRQVRATTYMFRLANANRRIRRLYVYTWFGKTTPRFDAGLVADGRKRRAYDVVRRQIRR